MKVQEQLSLYREIRSGNIFFKSIDSSQDQNRREPNDQQNLGKVFFTILYYFFYIYIEHVYIFFSRSITFSFSPIC
jgi:hypothetical protein